MRGRNWKIAATIAVGFLLLIVIVAFLNRKPTVVNEGTEVTSEPSAQGIEQPIVSPEMLETEQVTSVPESEKPVESPETQGMEQVTPAPETELPIVSPKTHGTEQVTSVPEIEQPIVSSETHGTEQVIPAPETEQPIVSPKTHETEQVTPVPETEQLLASPETQPTEQVTHASEASEPAVEPSPARQTNQMTEPPTEAPTSVPPTATPNPWKETEFPPTCEEAGYIVRENMEEGYTVIEAGKNALGHAYGEWVLDEKTGMYTTTCTRCGKIIQRRTTYEGLIPRIDFTGSMEGISKSNRVTLGFDFAGPTENFSCFAYTTWQGHNTLNYPKKNYTIRLYDDENITQKHKLIFEGWRREHKYVLKANYRDISQARNLLAADLWADMAACRTNLFDTLRGTPNYGAVDGFPVIVYLNGDFLGLYTLNLHIDDDLYQMDHSYDAVMIANDTEPKETRFYALASFEDQKNSWEVEFCGTGQEDQWAKDKLNELIQFVMTSEDDAFREHLADHLDVDGAIDYLLFLYVTGLQRNASKDLVFLKYHDCDVWIPTVYDMERAFGLSLDGSCYNSPEDFRPEKKDGKWDSGTDSLLWDRLLNLFEPEIRERYKTLREEVLTEEKMADRLREFIGRIPEEYYLQDLETYPRQTPTGQQPEKQIREYLMERLRMLDALWE